MSHHDDLYAELGLDPSATPEQIRAAYRKAAKRAHPDAGGDADAFQRVVGAYVVLSDPARRARYDESGDTDSSPDNSAAKLANAFAELFLRVMSKRNDIENVDVIAMMADTCDAKRRRVSQSIKESQRGEARILAAIERVQFKGTGPNLLRSVLDQQLALVRGAIADAERSLTELTALEAMLDDYGWQFDDPFAAWPPEARPPKQLRSQPTA